MLKHVKWIAAALLTASVPAQAAPNCMQPVEHSADQLRYIQVQLNVAALLCRAPEHQALAGYYNAYVTLNRQHLTKSVPALERLAYRQGISLDKYLTRTFNKVSLESYQTADFCGRTLAALKQAAGSVDPMDMLALLPISYTAPQDTCNLPGTTMAQGGGVRAARE